jgi:hypothetical protein
VKSVWREVHDQRLSIRDGILNLPYRITLTDVERLLVDEMWLYYNPADHLRDAVEVCLINKDFG